MESPLLVRGYRSEAGADRGLSGRLVLVRSEREQRRAGDDCIDAKATRRGTTVIDAGGNRAGD